MEYKNISIKHIIDNNCEYSPIVDTGVKRNTERKLLIFDKYMYYYEEYKRNIEVNLLVNQTEKYLYFNYEKINNIKTMSKDEIYNYLIYSNHNNNVFITILNIILKKVYNTDLENHVIELLKKYHYKSYKNNTHVNYILFEKELLTELYNIINFENMKIYISCVTMIKNDEFYKINNTFPITLDHIKQEEIYYSRLKLCINLYKDTIDLSLTDEYNSSIINLDEFNNIIKQNKILKQHNDELEEEILQLKNKFLKFNELLQIAQKDCNQ